MKRASVFIAALMLAASVAWADKPLGELDQGVVTGWDKTYDATVEVSSEHAAEGKHSLKVVMTPGNYPGFVYEAKPPQDWSAYEAVRLTVFNAGNDLKLAYRVDDAASKDFATRFQSDDKPLRLAKGNNELEISIASLRQGNLFSRGIDVTKISSIRFFIPGLKENTTLFVTGVKLVAGAAGPATLPLTDFGGTLGKLEEKEGTKISVARTADDKSAIKMDITGGKYPGVTLTNFPADWLGYDVLAMKFSPAGDNPLPDGVSIKISDNSRSMTFSTSLKENDGDVQMPVEMAGQLSLGKIKEISIFFEEGKAKGVVLGNLSLQRHQRVEYPSVHADAAPTEVGVKLDFTKLSALGKNSVFMAMLMVPVEGGKTRIVRCNSEVKGNVAYQVPADALANCPAGATIDAWGYLTEHNIWHFRRTTLKNDGTRPLELKFEDAKQFNH